MGFNPMSPFATVDLGSFIRDDKILFDVIDTMD